MAMISIYHKKIGDLWYSTAIEDKKIWGTAFTRSEEEALNQILADLPNNKPFRLEDTANALAEKIFDTMKSVLAGENVSWNFELEQSHLSPYAQKVLNCLAKVPLGYVTTYKALAKTAGGGLRAVGQIMALNPFVPLVPCHRVIKADFSLGGYGGSSQHSQLKQTLLQREDKGFEKQSKVKTECGLLELYPIRFLRKN
jgi:O-6-methylguanine DNA methyltransferase